MTNRSLAGLGLFAAVMALGLAYGLQYGAGLEPCPLCIFQRIAVAAFGLICLIGFVHGPGNLAARFYAGLATLAAIIGAAIALRHVWILHLPPAQVPACGPGLETLRHMLPPSEVVATVLRGDASCANIKASLFGLSLPAWSAIYFIGLSVGSLSAAMRQSPREAKWFT